MSAQALSSAGRLASCVFKFQTNALKSFSANTKHSLKHRLCSPFLFTLSTRHDTTPAAPDSRVEHPAPAPFRRPAPLSDLTPARTAQSHPRPPFHCKQAIVCGKHNTTALHHFAMAARASHCSGPNMKPRLIIHGGAGNLSLSYPPEVYDHYRTSLVTIVLLSLPLAVCSVCT